MDPNDKMEPEDNINPNADKKWYQVPEVRMLMYVIPVAAVFMVVALFLSNCGG